MINIRNIQRFCRILPTTNIICSQTAKQYKLIKKKKTKCLEFSTCSIILERPFRQFHLRNVLQKYSKQSSNEEESDDELDTEFKDERDSKVLKTKVNSLRADLLLRVGLGMARNKVEVAFYDSKIRVNGMKLSKKSEQLKVGDEVDVIRGFSQSNATHLYVSRVILLSANDAQEGLSVVLRRYKSLLIENYSGANAFKSSEVAAH